MADDAIAGLVKDLTSQLSEIAVQFGARADAMLTADTGTDVATGTAPSPRHFAERLLRQRAARYDFFPAEMFHEPAWDMLLALYVADEDGRTMNVKTLVSSTNAPATTSQRWIDHLHKLNLVDRVIDSVDRRRIEISLSEAGRTAILSYFNAIGAV